MKFPYARNKVDIRSVFYARFPCCITTPHFHRCREEPLTSGSLLRFLSASGSRSQNCRNLQSCIIPKLERHEQKLRLSGRPSVNRIPPLSSYTFRMLSRQSLLRAARTAAPRQSAILSQTRSFASPASTSDKVKPPVAVYGLDGTYATALVRYPPTSPARWLYRRLIGSSMPSFSSDPPHLPIKSLVHLGKTNTLPSTRQQSRPRPSSRPPRPSPHSTTSSPRTPSSPRSCRRRRSPRPTRARSSPSSRRPPACPRRTRRSRTSWPRWPRTTASPCCLVCAPSSVRS